MPRLKLAIGKEGKHEGLSGVTVSNSGGSGDPDFYIILQFWADSGHWRDNSV